MLEAPSEPSKDANFHMDEERVPDATVLLALHGDADLHAAPQLRDRLRAIVDRGASSVVVDLTETSFVDSTSLGVLLGGLKRQREEGGELHIVVSRPEIRRIFEITLLDQVFPLHESRADALAAISSETR